MPPFDVSRVSLSPPEKEVLEAARFEARLGELLALHKARPLLVQALYALICGEILEDVERPAQRLPAPAETGAFQLAVARARTVDPSAATPAPAAGLRQHVLGLYEALPRATHYEILEVPADASAPTIDAAYRRLTAEQDREWHDLAGDVQLSSMLSTLRLRRREAYLILSDPNRRAAYDRRLGTPLPAEKPQLVTAERHARARQLGQEARALLESGDRDRAIPLLLEAVDLDPDERASRRVLALTLAHHPSMQRSAERHFLIALEQEPADTDLRFRLAHYYRRLGLPARALVHLHAVLKADPDHADAARELAAIESEAPH